MSKTETEKSQFKVLVNQTEIPEGIKVIKVFSFLTGLSFLCKVIEMQIYVEIIKLKKRLA